MSKDINFCYLRETYLTNMEKTILKTVIKTGLDVLKNCF